MIGSCLPARSRVRRDDWLVLAKHQEAGERKSMVAAISVLPPAAELPQQSLIVEGKPWVLRLGRRKSVPVFSHGWFVEIVETEAFEDVRVCPRFVHHTYFSRESKSVLQKGRLDRLDTKMTEDWAMIRRTADQRHRDTSWT